MNRERSRSVATRLCRLVVLSAMSALPGLTRAAGSSTTDSDEPMMLSPFTVDTHRDVGFVATTSLAGGRLASNLADTPAAYSVLTREFIDALQIENLQQAIEWTVNTNVNPDNGAIQLSQVTNLYPMSRGVTAGTPQRNFFPFYVNFDSYNLDRFDFSRGPNSILFGTGALGGSANVVTKQARFDRTLGELTQTVGSWGNYRTAVDVNQPLNKRAAVRANAVWQDAGGWRDRDYTKVRGVSLTGTVRVGRGTEIRAEGEYGETSRMNAFTSINDGFAGWDGKTTFTAPLTTTPANANSVGISRISTPGYYVYAPGSGFAGVMNYQNSAITLGAGANAQVPIAGQLYVGGSPGATGSDILNALGLPGDRFANAIAGSQFRLPSRTFTQAFDAPVFWQRYKDAALYLNHSIGNTLFFEAAFDASDSFRYAEYTLNLLNTTMIDINRNLPDGTANPNFLVPYSEGAREQQVRRNQYYNARLAAAWVKDTRFGDFKVNAMGGINDQHNVNRFMQFNPLIGSDPHLWPLGNPIRYRYYWSDRSRPLPNFSHVTVVDPVLGTKSDVPTAWEPIPTQATLNSEGDQVYNYALAAVNAQLFKHRLVLLGAVRYDGYTNAVKYNSAYGDYPADWDGSTLHYRPSAPSDYASLTYIPKDAAGKPTGPALPADVRPRASDGSRLPQYANDRFKDDYNVPDIKDSAVTYSAGGVYHVRRWLSVYSNYAQTFTIPPPNATVYKDLLPATVSEGIDAGIRLNLLDQRLNLSLNRYFSYQQDQPFTGPVAGTIFNGIIDANAVGDFSANGQNIRNFPNTPPGFIQDRRDIQANGYEFEATANLSHSLRLMANFAIARVYAKNAGNLTARYIDQNLGALRQIVIDAGGLVDANDVATVDTSIPINQRSPDVNTAVSSWNSMLTIRKGLVPQAVVVQNTSSANIFADYTFRSGLLNGLRVGGGARYRGPVVIGNRASDTIVDPTNPKRAIDDPNVDAFTPVYSAGYTLATATLAYTWRFSKGHTVDFNLRIDNVLNEDKPHYVNTITRPIDGDVTNPARRTTPRNYSYSVPRSYTFTAKLSF